MTSGVRGRVLLALLLATIACDKSKPQRVRVPKAQRIAVPKRGGGPQIAGDPNPAPELIEVFRGARLVPIADGVDSGWAGIDARGETLWIGPVIDRLADHAEGRNALAIRREAFGQHVPAAGEQAELDDDELIDAGYADDGRLVVLVGPERQCIAARGRARVIAEVAGGHVLDLRWPLEGCGAGPWAPIGLLVDRQPSYLRWRAAECPEVGAIAVAWSAARPTDSESWTDLGAFMIGDEPHALVGHDGEQGVLFVAPKKPGGSWSRFTFDSAGLVPIRHGCAQPPISPRASDG